MAPTKVTEILRSQFDGCCPEAVIGWAWETFQPDIVATSSFQSQSIPLLHMISIAAPELPILFLDTGFHFPETLSFRDQIVQILGLNLVVIKPRSVHDGFRKRQGQLYQQDPDFCCHINKVEPFADAVREKKAWISGIRRDQTEYRHETPIIAEERSGLIKISPLASWSKQDVLSYADRHNLPQHPLTVKGYLSIGCAPCTRPVVQGGDERTGRWADLQKTECGLHVQRKKNP